MAAQVASRRAATGHQPASQTGMIQTHPSSNNLLNASQQRNLMGRPQPQSQQDRIPIASPRYNPVRNNNYKTQSNNSFTDNPEYRLPQPQPQERLQRRHRRSCSMTDFVPDIIIPDTYAQAPSPIRAPSVGSDSSTSTVPLHYSPNYSPGPVSAPSALPYSPAETVPDIKTKATTPPPVTSSKPAPPRRGRHVRRSSWSGNRPIDFDEQAGVESFDLFVNSGFQTAAADDGAFSGAQQASKTAAFPRNGRRPFDSEAPFLVASSPRSSHGDVVGRRVPIGLPNPSLSSIPKDSTSGAYGRKSGFSKPHITAINADADADSDDEFVELYGNARRHRAEAARALNALEKLVSTSSSSNSRNASATSPTTCSTNNNGAIRSSSGPKLGSPVALSPTSSPAASSAAGDRNPLACSPMSSRICRTIFGQSSTRNLTRSTDAEGQMPRSTSMQSAPSMKSNSAVPNRGSTLPFRMPSKVAQNNQSAAMNKALVAQTPAGLTGKSEKVAPLRSDFSSNASVTCSSPTFAQLGSLTAGGDRLQRRRSHDDGVKSSPMVCGTRVLRRVSFSSDVEFITDRE